MTGGEVLTEIKKDPSLACIPIVVLTTSKAPKDICHTARMGVNGYMQKPNSYTGYLQMFTNLREHWVEILEQPLAGSSEGGSANVAWC
jgi:CheY-like chemotaxis protein